MNNQHHILLNIGVGTSSNHEEDKNLKIKILHIKMDSDLKLDEDKVMILYLVTTIQNKYRPLRIKMTNTQDMIVFRDKFAVDFLLEVIIALLWITR